ncbi:MAG: A/G-specific adenine glycosylase [Elusimicrobiaceae bacterium]|nr:A/G-specific adenine glycosylase [Elusimicrobiaceae bacterium]
MKDFSKILLKWYKIHKRPLPWRDTQDPYRIWISEIILQQTRVAQGYDYFLRFMERFPDIDTLAAAPEDEVLKYWEGLGYYSRARNLHTAAKSMNGVFPSTYEGVLALKGVGEYTAAAICSFAYRMPYAVVDGNVYRVLARLFGIHTPTDTTEGKKEIATLAQKLLDKQFPDDHNQAIMDFGATQCVPQSPNCKVCPFVKRCKAYAADEVEVLPIRTAKVQTSKRYFTYIYVRQGGYTWLRRRPAGDIWQGLYELPMLETSQEITMQELKKTDFWKKHFSRLSPRLLQGPVKHVLSHRVIYAWCYGVEIPDGQTVSQGFIKVPENDVKKYAFPRLVQKFLADK